MLSTDIVSQIGIVPELDDVLHVIRGAGGTEVVFSRRVDCLQVGSQTVEQFEIEVGGIDDAFDINGILAGCRRGFVFGRKRPFRRSFLAYIEASCPIFASKTSRFRGSLSLSDSLLGMDFLLRTGAIINLSTLQLDFEGDS